jgi:hypothetical protein
VPNGGAKVVIGSGATACTVTVRTSNVPATARTSTGAFPTTLGTVTTQLYVKGTVNVAVTGSPCPPLTTATFVADRSTVGGVRTGSYLVNKTLKETT